MKVRELIEKLQTLDPEAPVFVQDSSYWDCEITNATPAKWRDLDGLNSEGIGVRLD